MQKAWFATYSGSTLCAISPEDIYWNCTDYDDQTEPLVFLLSEISNLDFNEILERDGYKITCRMVDDEYLNSLGEFDGW